MSQLRVDSITNEIGTGSPSLPNGLIVGDINYPATGALSNRNKIINGAMVIDQRNAGAAVTVVGSGYQLDRWNPQASATSKFSVQRNAGAVAPPTGFSNYMGFTSLSAYTVGSSEQFAVFQAVEGFNASDFAWGTASATPVTLSFWVRSSLTGVFGGSFRNSATDRSYPFTYTISAADTWEQKSITVPGDTSGTWLVDNGVGLYLTFGFGVGSTFSGPAGAWEGSNFISATGATSIVSTNGATFYITGVQLEAGTVATPFEHRLYGQELALCQRYCFTAPLANSDSIGFGYTNTTTSIRFHIAHPVTMRASPTITTQNVSSLQYQLPGGSGGVAIALSAIAAGPTGSAVDMTVSSVTVGQPTRIWGANTGGSYPCLIINAEL
jgi:hypothetical protein